MNWNFGFFDVHTLKRAAQAAGLGAGASALSPQEAEGAQLPGFQRNFVSRFVARNKENFPVGTVEPEVFAQIQEKLPEAQNIVSSGTHAGFTRFMKSGWHPAKTAARMGEILDSKEAAVVKNWQENTGKGVYAEYGILLPYKKDPTFVPFYLNNDKELVFKTLLPPSKGQMKKAGYGEEGGLLPLISRSHDAPSTQRMPLSAVTQQPAHGSNIDDALSFSKAGSGKVEGLDPASGRPTSPMSGLRGNPASAQPPGLSAVEERSSNVTIPEPLNVNNKFISTAGLTAGLGSGLALPGGAQAAGQRGENGEPSTFSALARQAALGTRGVLEGVGSGLTLGLGDPGRGLSDLLGLPVPQNETEQGRVGLNRSLAGVAGTGLLGAGLAKAPGAAVSAMGRALASNPAAEAMLTLGDENFGKMLEKGNEIMGLLEQYEHDFGGEDFF